MIFDLTQRNTSYLLSIDLKGI